MKVQDLNIVYICPDHNDKYRTRKLHMTDMLQKIGCKRIEFFKSSSEQYPKCLSNANIEILKKYLNEPVLILEDDVEFTGIDTFDFIDTADAIYFGISRSAGHPYENKDLGYAVFEPYSNTQVRVMNMLTTHAILYISEKYKLAVIDKLQESIVNNYYNDVLISRLQPQFLVLANKKPSFYQSSKFNQGMHEEHWTKWEIT
jgi:hypothetical protein